MSVTEPKRLTSIEERALARKTRDNQWKLMRRVAELGTLWFCVWNKASKPELQDELRCGLIDGLEYLEWIESHADWWNLGEWDDARYARPLSLTPIGHDALANWQKYDMEDVTGGLVEPGFIVAPLARGEG